MPEAVCIDRQHNIIVIDSRDHVGEEDLLQSLESVLRIVREDPDLKKVMVDATHQSSLPSTMALYGFASELARRTQCMKHAIVVSKEQSSKDLRFIETVAQNRGVIIGIFSSREDALSWLNR